MICNHRCNQHSENINHNDIGFGKAQSQKGISDQRRQKQYQNTFTYIFKGQGRPMGPFLLLSPVTRAGIIIRNNMNVQIRHIGDQFIGQCRFSKQMPPCHGTPPDNDFRHGGKPCKFSDLKRYIVAVHRLHRCAELLGQADIRPKPLFIFIAHLRKFRCFYKHRCKLASKRTGHPGRRTDNFGIGRRR